MQRKDITTRLARAAAKRSLAKLAPPSARSARWALALIIALLTTATAWAQDEISGLTYNDAGGYYEINDADDLNALAAYVNGGNNASGKTFKQTADIDMQGVTFTPIGNDEDTYVFYGTYDGDGYFIKNISYSNTGSHALSGMFGQVNGTVRNVNLKDCNFTGRMAGGIAGETDGSALIQNCNVLGGTITGTGDASAGHFGGIVGYFFNGTVDGCFTTTTYSGGGVTKGPVVGYDLGTVTNCYFVNAPYLATSSKGTQVTVYDISLGDGVTMSGNFRTAGRTAANTYHFGKESDEVTLGHGEAPAGYGDFIGYTVKDANDNDVTVTETSGVYSFTMPASNVTIGAEYLRLPYVAVSVTGGGTVTVGTQSVTAGQSFDVTTEKGASVVLTLAPESGNAVRSVAYGYTNSKGTNISGRKLPISDGTAMLTVPNDLKDGTGVTLTVTFAAALVGGADEASAMALTDATVTDLAGGWYKVESDITFDHTLNLLGDTHLTIASGKTMTVSTASDRGIKSEYTLTVGGAGALSVTASGSYPIAVHVGNYVQTGATVTASGFIGIRCQDGFTDFNIDNDFTFSGGQLTATGTSNGIWADNDITISCTNASDFIQSSSYSVSGGTVKVADGKALTDGTNIYSGTLTSAQISAIANKTLTKSSWTELKMALEADGTRTVTLTNNVMRVNSDCIEPSGIVTLDLNGYTIDGGTSQTNPLFRVNADVSLTITDSQTGGNLCNSGTNPTVAVNGGTLTLAAGTINAQSGGVYVYKGSFTMTGGIITGATISGVDLGDNATFTMTGGSITGNETGVNVGSANATFTVSGNVNITGNTKNSITTDVSLYYDGTSFNPIRIGGALNEAARIGINIDDYAASAITGDVVKVITNGLKNNGSKQNFVLNGRDGLTLVNNTDGEVTIAKIYSLTVPENVTVSGLTAESGNTYNVGCGDVVTLLYGADDVTSGWSVRYTVPNGAITYLGAVDAQGKYAEFTMPGDNTTITKADIDNHFTFGGITLKESFSSGASQGLDATFDGTSEVTIDLPNPITVKSVKYNRTFTTGKCATIMLPFSMDVSNISGTNFYTFGGVEKNSSDKWIATMNQVTGTLAANTPYLVEPTATTLTFTGGATLNTTGGSNQQTADAGSNWTFKGTYAYREWITDGANSDEIGKAYGFAGVQKTGIEIGDFVRVASGAKIRPMGCYLLWSDTPNAAPARRMTRAAAADELPSRITVRLVGSNGETTGIGELDTKTGELSFDGWWTLDGVKLSGRPTKKGLYINNGKKIVIK